MNHIEHHKISYKCANVHLYTGCPARYVVPYTGG